LCEARIAVIARLSPESDWDDLGMERYKPFGILVEGQGGGVGQDCQKRVIAKIEKREITGTRKGQYPSRP
jgi:hypothetical protein